MEKEFINYEQALALKELQFNEPCLGFRYIEKNKPEESPTYSQAFRWFREKYDLDHYIRKDWQDGVCLGYESIIECEDGTIDYGTYNIYEEAELACLKKLIEIVKHK